MRQSIKKSDAHPAMKDGRYSSLCSTFSDYNFALFQKQHIIHPHFTFLTQITDHITVQCRLIHTARLRIARAQSKMNRSTHLLIKQHILCAPINTGIVAKGKLTKIASACIYLQHMLKVRLSLVCARFDYFPLAEYQAHSFNRTAIV